MLPIEVADSITFEQWFYFGKGSKGKTIWRLRISAIWWSLWLERNNRMFENSVKPSYRVCRRVQDRCL